MTVPLDFRSVERTLRRLDRDTRLRVASGAGRYGRPSNMNPLQCPLPESLVGLSGLEDKRMRPSHPSRDGRPPGQPETLPAG
jgi:hypothetical protein